ncbi:MAG: hypothetical protein ACTH4C_01615 [Psychrobacter celer]|uniref:hypothetical protein n=1 Tax=Psychrobacter celer TaxID=306572 RepID=UPI003FB7AE4D
MDSITALRIDTAIEPKSRLRLLLHLSLASIMIGLGILASLALWQYVLVLVVAAAVVGYLTVSRPILLHLSQPPLSQRLDQHWQLLMCTAQGEGLWLADLQAVHRFEWALSFEFDIIEPYQRSLAVTVFRDQVSPEQWRELSVLANMSTGNTV